jgi:plastocyanin
MKKLLTLPLILLACVGFSKSHIIKNIEVVFTPEDIIVGENDTIIFDLESNHDAVQVSEDTYMNKGKTPLESGFSTPFGGGTIYAKDLGVGTAYYICTPHASIGMIGTIKVKADLGTFTFSNDGLDYTPSTITVGENDMVNFDLEDTHDAVQVSKETWDNDGNTALESGFSVPFGGGTVNAQDLGVGTHYYVCTPHASLGMKGIIIVKETSTNVAEAETSISVNAYPNPSNGNFTVTGPKGAEIEVFNVTGSNVYSGLISGNFQTVNVSGNGTYLLRVSKGGVLLSSQTIIVK